MSTVVSDLLDSYIGSLRERDSAAGRPQSDESYATMREDGRLLALAVLGESDSELVEVTHVVGRRGRRRDGHWRRSSTSTGYCGREPLGARPTPRYRRPGTPNACRPDGWGR